VVLSGSLEQQSGSSQYLQSIALQDLKLFNEPEPRRNIVGAS
jgi:hypothetical protein